MRNILSGARGMSPVVLVILIAWALLAVIFLTGTLLAARSIDRSVSGVTNRTADDGTPEKNIADTVDEIKTDTKFIDEARKTVQISTAIRKAAEPLSGRLARTLEVADKGIDPKLKSIRGKVGDINETAGQINTNAKGIGTSVGTIFTSVGSINASVLEIGDSVQSIGRRARSIRRTAGQINGSARGILGNAGSVLANVQSIDVGAADINKNANGIQRVAEPIQKDLSDVLGLVGTTNGSPTILGHANGIDCSSLINLFSPDNMCNR